MSQNNEAELPDMIDQILSCEMKITVMCNDKMHPNLNIFDLNRFSSYTKFCSMSQVG